jgi:hypothetical protein
MLGQFGELSLSKLGEPLRSLAAARLKIAQFRLKTGLSGQSTRLASRNKDGIMAAFEGGL